VPVVLGAAHQAGALLLLTIGLSIAFFGRSSGHQRIREGQ
jgi:heme A synthase